VDLGEPADPELSTAAGPRTRGAVGTGYHLITEANRARSVLPELTGATVCKLVTPRRAPARFAEYLVELEPGAGTPGETTPPEPSFEHFVYCLAGSASTFVDGDSVTLGSGDFAFIADHDPFALCNLTGEPAQLIWVKRRYEPIAGLDRPTSRSGLWRRELIGGGDARHDFSMILMRFAPGGDLGMVEIHDEEHGLYMTAGGGRYLLDREEHRVERGDFIYMAPYCPQGFVADASDGAEYLLYKDVFR